MGAAVSPSVELRRKKLFIPSRMKTKAETTSSDDFLYFESYTGDNKKFKNSIPSFKLSLHRIKVNELIDFSCENRFFVTKARRKSTYKPRSEGGWKILSR